MDRRGKAAFLALVVVHALHSIEEYAFRLYEVFPPARFVSGLFASDLRTGFIIFHMTLVIFGLWCYAGPVRRNGASARILVWFWVVIEIVNGVGHPAWAIAARGYVPGAATAPFLLILAVYLAYHSLLSKTVRSEPDATKSAPKLG